nr:acyloxyacyl hydrolase [Azospirillum picis]
MRPWLGADVNTDAGLWTGGGFLLDFTFGNFVVTPSVGVGLWSRGNSKDLGYPVEFRTTLEGGYRFDDQSRLTVFYSHKSNAGFSDDNHGVDSFGLSYHIPVSKLF